ncbi:serine protease family S33 [Thraustotheca clavata]|uniref:Serine protease family S33 n=1 Tax=Thraustotheca clavata TaxID=74557 RepID=A0A1V9ZXG4_9STRA|nr:serine protease family S33 [Thraustotheca clavata]
MLATKCFHRVLRYQSATFSSVAQQFPAYGSIQNAYTLKNGEKMWYTKHGPENAESTFVLIHGAPGSHMDFKYLAPLLIRENINVLSFDLPGNGRTLANAAGGISGLTSATVGNAVIEALNGLSLKQSFILGHSFGGHTAIQAASAANNVRGLALLNGSGMRPHQAIRPFGVMKSCANLLFKQGLVRDTIVKLNYLLYIKVYKFPRSSPVDDVTFAFQRFGTSDYNKIAFHLDSIANRNLPSFIAIALDDHLVEKEIGYEMRDVLKPKMFIEYPKGVEASVNLSNGYPIYYTKYGSDEAPITFILIHGSPGSRRDFKYLAPLLISNCTNVISFDLPGFGKTSAKAAGGIERINTSSIDRALSEAIVLLQRKNCILVGHSMGGLTVLHVTANSALRASVRGIALLNSCGLRAHKARWPRMEFLWSKMVRLSGRGSNALTRYNQSIYVDHLGFSKSTPEYDCVCALYRVASIDYPKVNKAVKIVAENRVPSFVAVSEDDVMVESIIGQELAEALNSSVFKVYATGGHNIQKNHAKDIASELLKWVPTLVPILHSRL